eukprot:365113-Chlamydomonas_euryale.AAC.6
MQCTLSWAQMAAVAGWSKEIIRTNGGGLGRRDHSCPHGLHRCLHIRQARPRQHTGLKRWKHRDG